ncbi:MAG: transpeptidase family protein [Alphaproteobacteria bacterium]|nr:transpeptidase family protein [Alphaproteobacteria bacterium]
MSRPPRNGPKTRKDGPAASRGHQARNQVPRPDTRSTVGLRTPGLAGLADKLRLRPGGRREPDGLVRARSTTRLAFVGMMVLFGYIAVAAQSAWIMLLPDEQLEDTAAAQFESAVQDRGVRGDILDRDGRVLASTVELAAVHIDPALLSEDGARRLARTLAPALGEDADEMASRLLVPGRRDVRLADGLTPVQVAELKALVHDDAELKHSLFIRKDPHRFYPGRGDGTALLGVVGATEVGLAGLERVLDDQLGGDVVKYVRWRDRKGRRVTLDRPEARPGNDVTLTIDARIQRVTEAALVRAWQSTEAAGAYAVVMDVETGDILAMATVPGLNPNDGASLEMGLLKNRSVMDAIEPGSVFKPFVAAAALEDGMITEHTVLNCEKGAWVVGRKRITDEHPIGEATVGEVIKYSSNICAAKIALELGPEKTLGALSGFGFGRETGLGLPGETRGLLRDPESIRRIELATTAYGYGASASAVQLAAAIGTLGNHGVRMKPRLVAEVRNANGDLERRNPVEEDRRVVSAKTADMVVEMMEAVTRKGGTGTKAAVPGYRVAGKTGTAKKLVDGNYGSRERIGSFVGLIPADEPKLAIAVVVDGPTVGPRFGGWTAGPAFKEIAQDSLRILGVPPDPVLLAEAEGRDPLEPVDEPVALPAVPAVAPAVTWTADGRLRTPDLSGLSLRDALGVVEGTGLALQVSGSGRVTTQQPGPGTVLDPGASLEVALR